MSDVKNEANRPAVSNYAGSTLENRKRAWRGTKEYPAENFRLLKLLGIMKVKERELYRTGSEETSDIVVVVMIIGLGARMHTFRENEKRERRRRSLEKSKHASRERQVALRKD